MADAPTAEIPTLPDDYVVPKVWSWDRPSGGQFANINRPIAGATHDKVLPVGTHPLQLYSLGTPNGVKVSIMLEELLAAGHEGAEYDAWLIDIGEGDQFGSGFVEINPNSKIPAPSCPRTRPRGPRRSTGYSGRWARARSSAAASAISTCMRRSRFNMQSTATPWR
jgi:hypothetical protein